ncbi:hypothetical protein V8B55DRAFT_1578252 [Mucor lusitanicus]|uniref:Uncharacterized protein n=2 Tax=Mucor circinelloides f. lusitanicus TaxID=29924 RepID=A0A162YT10_MUCCL|nr:hypothetical protein MUCCIDRAFT_85846 [Mucor lusitanicus CBS 277.49]
MSTAMNDAIALVRTELLEVQDSIFNAAGKTAEQLGELRTRRDDLTRELQAMLEVERLTAVVPGVPLPVETSSGSNKVPNNLPYFQCENCVRDTNKHVFVDVAEALSQFEVVLKSCKLDLNTEWERLLPLCLGKDLRDWLVEFMEASNGHVCGSAAVTPKVLRMMILLRPKVQDLLDSALASADGRAAIEARRKAKAKAGVVKAPLSEYGCDDPGTSEEGCEVLVADDTSSLAGLSVSDNQNAAADSDVEMTESYAHTGDEDVKDLVGRASFLVNGGRCLTRFTAAEDQSVVQLAHGAYAFPRVGAVALEVEYNKISSCHTFEIFSFYSEENVHVLLRMDILSKINIGLGGLVSQHGFQTGPRMTTDPINDSIKPNNHPFGNDEERALFAKLLNDSLLKNSRIHTVYTVSSSFSQISA